MRPNHTMSQVPHELLPLDSDTGLYLGRIFSICQEIIDYGNIYDAKEHANRRSVGFSAAAEMGAHLV